MEYDELVIKVNNTSTTDTSNLVKKKLSITQKLMKLKIKFLTMIMLNILLLNNIIS